MAKILVSCGAGIATSTMAANKLKEGLKERGKLQGVTIDQCKVAEVASKAQGYDLIVSTTQVPSRVEKPVVSGIPFLTGVGLDKAIEEVIEKLDL